MYQSIDDPQDEDRELDGTRLPLGLWMIGALAIIAVFALVYLSRPSELIKDTNPALTDDARRTYLTAISETDAAMRRARLQDFMRVYPTNPRANAALAQLDVINLWDNKAWNAVTRDVYENDLTQEERLAILDSYNDLWGGSLLGGRDAEITALRAEIMGTPDESPKTDRRLDKAKSPIPTNIQDDALVGAPRRAAPPRAPVYTPPPAPKVVEVERQVVVMPRIRRNSSPRYPRKAYRKRVPGVVTLSLNIDENGEVAMTELVSVQANRYEKDFVKAAEKAARKTRFHPKTINGEPVAATGVLKRYRFERN